MRHRAIGCAEERSASGALHTLMRLLRRHILYELPKNKIYQHAAPGAALKELFVQQVEQIVWQYKLAPETINLPAKPSVPEIQVFDISLKTSELDQAVLRCIDKAIPFPIVFQLYHDKRIKMIAAYKRPNEADSEKWVVDGYFASDWQAQDLIRQPLPVVLDLALLYEHMLRRLLPLPPRPDEVFMNHVQEISAQCQTLPENLQKQ